MVDRYPQRDTPSRIEALIQAALASDHGKRKLAAAQTLVTSQIGRLTSEAVIDIFKRHLDISVSHQLSQPSDFQVGYHAYAASGLAERAARRLAEEFLSRAGKRY